MTTKRKVLTIIFLLLFLPGGLGAIEGSLAGVFTYWFFLGVIFTALWFLLGPGTAASSLAAPSITPPPSAQSPAPPAAVPPAIAHHRIDSFPSLHRQTKIGWVEGIGWFFFLFFIPTMIRGGNPIGSLMGAVGAVVGFRSWCRRRTHIRALAVGSTEQYGQNIYLPALWSYAWRSFLAMWGFAAFFGVLGMSMETAAATLGATLVIWFLGSLLVLDVPYWVFRRLRTETHAAEQKKGM